MDFSAADIALGPVVARLFACRASAAAMGAAAVGVEKNLWDVGDEVAIGLPQICGWYRRLLLRPAFIEGVFGPEEQHHGRGARAAEGLGAAEVAE
jgi:glutathione S-transferase